MQGNSAPNRQMKTTGFTIVEVLVVITINTILLVGITLIVQTFYTNNSYTFAQTSEVDNARQGVQGWVRDFREATVAEDGTFPVGVATDDRLVFYSDVAGDRAIELVEFALSTTTLERRVYRPVGFPPSYGSTPDTVTVLSRSVRNASSGIPVFSYFDRNGAPITNPTARIGDIRYVEMQLRINVDPTRTPDSVLLRSSAAPRNLKDNL
jgi:type II secretory pathway pseudopilin PulG